MSYFNLHTYLSTDTTSKATATNPYVYVHPPTNISQTSYNNMLVLYLGQNALPPGDTGHSREIPAARQSRSHGLAGNVDQCAAHLAGGWLI